MMYLYCFEDGMNQIHKDPPTDVDLASIEDGLLQVFEINGDIKYVNESGETEDCDQCTLMQDPHNSRSFFHAGDR